MNMKLVSDLKALVARKLVTERMHSNGKWAIYKYSKRVFFDALWNEDPLLNEARGLVIDTTTGRIVQYPFTKVYNHTEQGAGSLLKDDDPVLAVTKVNGFLGVASLQPDGTFLVTTSGSFESPFVELATKYLDTPLVRMMTSYHPNTTFMFEIVDPSDPHIVKETPGAYLIGARSNDLGSELWTEAALDMAASQAARSIFRPSWSVVSFGEVKKVARAMRNIEGFMVRDPNTTITICKLKTTAYLNLKFLSRASYFLTNDFDRMSLRQKVEEEMYTIIDYIFDAHGAEHFKLLSPEDRVKCLRWVLENTTQ